jgi:hypothetical protein
MPLYLKSQSFQTSLYATASSPKTQSKDKNKKTLIAATLSFCLGVFCYRGIGRVNLNIGINLPTAGVMVSSSRMSPDIRHLCYASRTLKKTSFLSRILVQAA